MNERYSQATWDARYRESDRVWSGNPNPRLVEHVTGLTPGDALDVGAGEGADSVWLARQGWQVTALDISPVALDRTRTHAEESGVTVATVQHDLLGDAPLPGSYDLVSAQFWHPPLDRFADFRDVLGAAVRPGGMLLVVGHHPADLSTGLRDGHGHAELLFTPEKVAALFAGDAWEVRVAAAPTREVAGADGPVTVTDSVLLAVRR
ncbi:methyltransferase domain-containing protein [Nocardioides marmoriginsengisoli]|uniref:Methyltransferase domain-containing protein n=1 Tax=Nocardioides marmoriginsengisoli TaxID=661483 RepID=A0A3N0CLQ2_9ACTN|nr:class I SAM-dependent methyltransferase [Nocardioides marmoriginsengisoli]RNL64340.1 methyltransferase domain-containing protein [Nocardioides marmoriginsengisoli]